MSVEIRGLRETIADLEAVEGRIEDLEPVLLVMAEDLKTLIDDSFENSVSPSGRPWEPLKPATIAQRRANSDKPLVDTGRLRNSISATAESRSIVFGTNVVYGGTHQFGRGPIPARPYLPVTPSQQFMNQGPADVWLQELREAVRRYVVDGEI